MCTDAYVHIPDMATIQRKISIPTTPNLTDFFIKSIKLGGLFKTNTILQYLESTTLQQKYLKSVPQRIVL